MNIFLQTGNFELDRAFRIAIGDIAGNIQTYQSGLLNTPRPVLCAGLSYPDPWTRDAALNTWSGAGLIFPKIMKNTLLSCLTHGDATAGMGTGCFDEAGSQVPADCISIAGQYWDRIIWTIGAWSYYCQNEDRTFLEMALEATQNSLNYLEEHEFDTDLGLFRGGSCIHDGIGGYSDVYVDTASGAAIYGWPAQNPDKRHPKGAGVPIHALSTNCLYAEAYRLVGVMQTELAESVSAHHKSMHERVKAGIQKHLWQADKGCFRYYIDPWDGCGGRQEALGNAFAVLFGGWPTKSNPGRSLRINLDPLTARPRFGRNGIVIWCPMLIIFPAHRPVRTSKRKISCSVRTPAPQKFTAGTVRISGP